jgi:hypothetical protein
MLHFDIFSKICGYLDDTEKINFTMISTITDQFKYKLIYVDKIDEARVAKLSFYDNFECISTNCMYSKRPRNVKRLYINGIDEMVQYHNYYPDLWRHFITPTKIQETITHIIFCDKFDQPINDYIPDSVTHLKFGRSFNCPILNCIPDSVTHLEFGLLFNQPIKDCIPNSLKHLKFGNFFNQSAQRCIPNSVTHLRFGKYYGQSIKNSIPDSVTHLVFGKYFNKSIENRIPHSVTHLTLGTKFDKFKTPLPESITHLRIGETKSRYDGFTLILSKNECYCSKNPHVIRVKMYIPDSLQELTIVCDNDMDSVD